MRPGGHGGRLPRGDGGLTPLSAEAAAALFTRSDGSYLCARWGRPIVPVVFGLDDATLPTVKGAIETVVVLAGHRMAESDPELGANLLIFFVRDWAELRAVPDLDRLVPDLGPLTRRLADRGANQYRHFRFDPAGGIRACFSFVRMDDDLAQLPAEVLALNQAVQMILLWSDTAFTQAAPLVQGRAGTMVHPDVAGVIRAAYDPVLPVMADDPAHALRLAARLARRR